MSSAISRDLQGVEVGGIDSTGVVIEAHELGLRSPQNVPLLQNISFYLPARSLVAVTGPSSAAVSALLEVLAGSRSPMDGKLLIDGANLNEYRGALIPTIGYVSPRMALHSGLTPGEALRQAALLRLPHGMSAASRSHLVEQELSFFDLEAEKSQTLSRLSAQSRFRAQIAVEAVGHPGLLLVDEPGEMLPSGAELDLVDLYRGLAQSGTTVLFAASSARAMLSADLLIFLGPDGSLAWFGPPGDASGYFDSLRGREPRIPPLPGLDDISYVLGSSNGAAAASWASWYQASPAYAKYVDAPLHRKNRDLMLDERPLSRIRGKTSEVRAPVRVPRSTAIQQYFLFLSRDFVLFTRDAYGLVFAFLAPLLLGIGVLLAVSPALYDPVRGSAAQIDLILGVLVFLSMLIASFSRLPDVLRDNPVFRRERQLSAGVLPYVLAKLTLIIPIAVFQGIVLTVAYFVAVGFAGGAPALLPFLATLILVGLAGGVTGLAASALAPSIRAGVALVLFLVIPQLLFSSAVIPGGSLGPVGQAVSAVMPARYGFEALVTASGYGRDVAGDVCWALPPPQRKALTDAQKQGCGCTGSNIFSSCNFPGIRQPAAGLVDQPAPVEPTPDPAMNQIPVQPSLRQGETLDQYAAEISKYTLQLETYQGVVSSYLANLRQYAADETAWQKTQSYAIGDAESRIASELSNYGQIYSVNLISNWMILIGMSAIMAILFTGIQSRKGRG